MASTIVGYFEDYEEARSAERDLVASGFKNETTLVGQSVDGMHLTEGTQHESWWDRVKSAFGVDDENELGNYREATSRGGTLVTVRVSDEQTNAVADILERHHPVDLDQRAESWQGTGASAGKTTLTGTGANLNASEQATSKVSVPLAEEELRVGKRAVQRGALRIHTYVTERPVEEQVTLREEQAYVDRRPVDRAVGAGEAAFQDRTIEVQELAEEAVVSKQARVVEEVTVGKEQTSRTETVRDKVRKEEVEVSRDDTRVKR
ncbi:MAG: hypothetical protein JWN48_1576 [Myxococcaceae bacterium]|nr:hypothetical protein [Myxococcaceae bacterium]